MNIHCNMKYIHVDYTFKIGHDVSKHRLIFFVKTFMVYNQNKLVYVVLSTCLSLKYSDKSPLANQSFPATTFFPSKLNEVFITSILSDENYIFQLVKNKDYSTIFHLCTTEKIIRVCVSLSAVMHQSIIVF